MLKTRHRSLRSRFARVLACGILAAGVVAALPPVNASALSLHAQHQPSTPDPAKPFGDAAPVVLMGSLANMKDPNTLSKKFVTRASAAAPDYQAGVATAGQSWETAAGASEASYDAGVQAAIAAKRFGKGISGKGAKYQQNATTLGVARYPQGVANAGNAWATGVTPFLNVLKGANIGPKGPRGSALNQQRSAAVQTLLNKTRVGQ